MATSLLGAHALTTPTPTERRVIEAIKQVIRPMLESDPIAVSYGALAKAAIAALDDVPRVPAHTGARSVNGTDVLGVAGPVSILVDARRDVDDDGVVVVGTTLGGTEVPDAQGAIVLGPTEARAFFLAGLAACDAAERAPQALPAVFLDEKDRDPGCDTTPGEVTLTGKAPTGALDTYDSTKDVT